MAVKAKFCSSAPTMNTKIPLDDPKTLAQTLNLP